QITLDGVTSFQTSGTTWSVLLTALTSGTHTITATVTDNNGNTGTSSVTITVNTPLTISITSPTNGALLDTNTLTLSGTASGSNIQSVQVSIDGGTANQASGTTSWSFLTSPLTYGTHTITATVTDSSGKTATASLKIIKDSPPVLTVPADMTVIPTSTSGAPVSYTVKATDDSGQVSVACLPPSGSTFSIGTNSVTCTATDSGGNKATGSFKVTVLNPAQAIQQLMNTINGMNLPLTVTTNLDTRLANALTNYNAGLINNAQNNLNTFINNVNSNCCSLSKPIINDQANLLTSTARNIINSM
ncbi:MAG: HYR domain-containing protein, partial [Thaumarchaeota archaeon]